MTGAIDSSAVLWSAPERLHADRPLLVLLHGLGSHEGDLFSLAPALPLEPVLASLRAPYQRSGGWSWFPPDEHLFAGPGVRPSTASVDGVLGWLDEQSFASVGLLGFSQGAAMAIELLRRRPRLFRYAVALSGPVLEGDDDGDPRLAEVRPPVFWGRGTTDDVVPDWAIRHAQRWLPQHTTLTERIYEDVPHAISSAEVGDISRFIRKHL